MNRIYLVIIALTALVACSKRTAPTAIPSAPAEIVKPVVFERDSSWRKQPIPLPTVAPFYFGVNSDTLTGSQKARLGRLVKSLKKFPNSTITVSGCADTTGKAGYNLRLSHRRATRVLEALVAAGIEPSRLSAAGYGEASGPLDKARKVTITIHP